MRFHAAVLPRSAGAEGAEDAPDADLRPFRPPVELGLDPGRMEPYRRRWDIDVPQIAVGVTDNGQFLADVILNFSDLLGDQRLLLRAYSVSGFSNIDATYLNLGGRLDWGARFVDYRDYFVSGYTGDQIEQEQRYSELSAFAQYPLSRHYRVEGSIGYSQQRTNYPFLTETGIVASGSRGSPVLNYSR